MNIYKVVFARNEVISVHLINKKINLTDDYSYEHDKKHLIYALVNAESETDAIKKSDKIIKEFNEKTYGKDFIN